MRIRTDGDKAWRKDAIERAAEVADRNKTDSVIDACLHLVADQEAKRELSEYLADQVATGTIEPALAQEITEILGDTDRADHRNDLVFTPSVSIEIEGNLEKSK
ncbi:MAG: DUF7692 domain-containing protein [Natronomonas sp.]